MPKQLMLKLIRKGGRGFRAPALLARPSLLLGRLGRASRGYVLAGAGVVVAAVAFVSLLSWLAPDSDRPIGSPLEAIERVAGGVLEQVDDQVTALLGTDGESVLQSVREGVAAASSRTPWPGGGPREVAADRSSGADPAAPASAAPTSAASTAPGKASSTPGGESSPASTSQPSSQQAQAPSPSRASEETPPTVSTPSSPTTSEPAAPPASDQPPATEEPSPPPAAEEPPPATEEPPPPAEEPPPDVEEPLPPVVEEPSPAPVDPPLTKGPPQTSVDD